MYFLFLVVSNTRDDSRIQYAAQELLYTTWKIWVEQILPISNNQRTPVVSRLPTPNCFTLIHARTSTALSLFIHSSAWLTSLIHLGRRCRYVRFQLRPSRRPRWSLLVVYKDLGLNCSLGLLLPLPGLPRCGFRPSCKMILSWFTIESHSALHMLQQSPLCTVELTNGYIVHCFMIGPLIQRSTRKIIFPFFPSFLQNTLRTSKTVQHRYKIPR